MTPLDVAAGKVKKILLIEADPQDAELTLAALVESDLASQVEIVRDSGEALEYLRCQGKYSHRPPGNPFLLLLDSKMPKAGSLRLLKRIKVDERLKTISVVALDSPRETADMVELYKHGVVAYMVKPVDFSRFAKTIHQLGFASGAIHEPLFVGS
jgi:CheY-like chemotaxis protein